ncbi:hypothetical protein [Chryseobacterium sp. RU33C]|uniref:hypothetical protein n=1 Tax=Chryseobacterium sp. RU33C TaxID=1907398 RepID=UPI0009562115|nr:hypothetical protein [Chryseobacterium sp. RU33C]SIQ19649.1 hypothetical protein SAMN05880573_103176 [Chryseobacterium sp. RU33C]
MNKQLILKILLILFSVTVSVYTIFAFQQEGASLFQIFLTNITSFNWNGQFNLDFSCYLLLSGLWIMWRNEFSTKSIIFGIIASIIGIIVFAPYILYLLQKEKGNIQKVIIGNK